VDDPQEDPAPASGTVGVADAQAAADIARAIRLGKTADRTPTLEQLLAAFGEIAPTHEARSRAKRAMDLAGINASPDVMDAPAGERLMLSLGGSPGASGRRLLLGLVAVGLIILVAALAATLAGGGGSSLDESLPVDTLAGGGSTTLTVPAGTAATTAPALTDTTASTPSTTATATSPTTTTPASTTTPAAAGGGSAPVTVRVDASNRPTYLCAEDGTGKQLYAGTLSGRQTFRATRVKLNVGLGSTVVTLNGRPVQLDGSPAGVDISASGAKSLPLGQRPCA
jgi:hypothetical protein